MILSLNVSIITSLSVHVSFFRGLQKAFERGHSTLGYLSPDEFGRRYYAAMERTLLLRKVSAFPGQDQSAFPGRDTHMPIRIRNNFKSRLSGPLGGLGVVVLIAATAGWPYVADSDRKVARFQDEGVMCDAIAIDIKQPANSRTAAWLVVEYHVDGRAYQITEVCPYDASGMDRTAIVGRHYSVVYVRSDPSVATVVKSFDDLENRRNRRILVFMPWLISIAYFTILLGIYLEVRLRTRFTQK